MSPQMRSLLKWTGRSLLVLLALVFSWWSVYHVLASRRMSAQLDALRAAGFAFELRALAPELPPSDQNAAGLYFAAFALAVEPSADERRAVEKAKSEGFGSRPVGDKGFVRAWLDRNAESFDFAARARARTRCVFERDWSLGYSIPLPELAKLRELGRGLALLAEARAEEGRFDQARDAVQSLFSVSEALREDLLFISQLVRYAIARTAFRTVQACVRPEASEPELRAWLAVLPPAGWLQGSLGKAMRAELAFGVELLPDRFGEVLFEGQTGGGRLPVLSGPGIALIAMRPVILSDGARWLALLQRYCDAADRPYLEVGAGMRAETDALESGSSQFWQPVTRTLMFHVPLDRPVAAEAWCAVTRAGLDCELARRATGAYPARVEALDPLSGKPLVYVPEKKLLYSVGEGEADNGGVDDPKAQENDFVWALKQ